MSWAKSISKLYLFENKKKDKNGVTNLDKTKYCLINFDWILNSSNIKAINRRNIDGFQFPTNSLLDYKKTYWRYNIIHHEDVLFFTYQIFKTAPKVIEFVTNKFPYIFIDEFQDTTPLQSWIITKIAEKGTIIGVIGDPAQSIYRFAGANRSDFDKFTLPNLIN